jgi:hypothetical protein
MKTLIVEYLRLKAAEIGGVDEHLGLTEKREGGDVSVPYIYVGGGDIRPVDIDSGSLGWFRTYQKEEFVTVDGMRAARDIQGTFYIRYAAILHRDTRNHNEYAEDVANAFTGISADLKQILKARKVDISRSSIETDITRAWREEFTTPVTDLNYRLGMVLVDVTVNVTGSRDCWQGCSELADILQGFDWCNPATFQRLTEAQQECVSDQICPIPEPCEDGTVNITDSSANPIASVQVASGGVEPFPLPDTPVQAVDSAATVGASGNVLSVTGGDVAIPDKDYTDSDGVVKSVAAFAPIVCTPQTPTPYPATWQPNPDWPTLPTVIATDEVLYGVYKVFANEERLRVSHGIGNSFTVDPGDGSAPFNTVAGTNDYFYDYATLAATEYDDRIRGVLTGRKVKYVVVTITPLTTLTRIDLNVTNSKSLNWADIVCSLPNGEAFTTGTNSFTFTGWQHLERMRVIEAPVGMAYGGAVGNCPNIAVFEFAGGTIFGTGWTHFRNCGAIEMVADLVHTGGAPSFYAENSRVIHWGDVTFTSSVGNIFFSGAKFITIGTVTVPAATTNFQNAFQNTTACNSPIHLVADGLSNLVNMCRYSSTPKFILDDASLVTNTTNAFDGANVSEGVILNGITVGFSLNGTQCSSQGAYDTMDALGTAAGSQTIDCRNTPFAVDYAATDALAISAFNLGTSKGFTLTMA